ncbi:MAG TPA: hypothetical protein VLB68_03185 [Pyrinomonadaceae bacterium]|nr:hypothetical protein [Pyrinomonadaceae bacterium]
MLDHQLVDGGLLDQPALLLLVVATVATFALSAHDICGQFVDIFRQSDLSSESMSADIPFRDLHIAMAHQCFDRESVVTGEC